MDDKRVVFDFAVRFSNGGGLHGEGFRLDIEGEQIEEDVLARAIIADLGLAMVDRVTISNAKIITEPHKKRPSASDAAPVRRFVDLSHDIEDGMVPYRGLPAPRISEHLSFATSRASYAPGTEFQIGKIDMVANTGTYIDTPYHRHVEGDDLSTTALERLSSIPGLVIRVTGMAARDIDWTMLAAYDVKGRAVLIETGWDRHWQTDAYFEGHPYLTRKAAEYLRDQGAVIVGIDSLNIDDTSDAARPVHSILLGAGIPIVEHLTGLSALPPSGFRFTAAPPKIKGMGTFPVRAHAIID